MIYRRILHPLLLLFLWAGSALALDYKLAALEIGQPWARATAPSAKSGGGYLVIRNTGTAPDRLIAVKSPAADKVEVHEMKMEGNIMRMRAVENGIEIPPGATVELKPGGFHIMFMGLKAPFAKDAKVRRPWCSRKRAASTSSSASRQWGRRPRPISTEEGIINRRHLSAARAAAGRVAARQGCGLPGMHHEA